MAIISARRTVLNAWRPALDAQTVPIVRSVSTGILALHARTNVLRAVQTKVVTR